MQGKRIVENVFCAPFLFPLLSFPSSRDSFPNLQKCSSHSIIFHLFLSHILPWMNWLPFRGEGEREGGRSACSWWLVGGRMTTLVPSHAIMNFPHPPLILPPPLSRGVFASLSEIYVGMHKLSESSPLKKKSNSGLQSSLYNMYVFVFPQPVDNFFLAVSPPPVDQSPSLPRPFAFRVHLKSLNHLVAGEKEEERGGKQRSDV